jgi:hypothetical protein
MRDFLHQFMTREGQPFLIGAMIMPLDRRSARTEQTRHPRPSVAEPRTRKVQGGVS